MRSKVRNETTTVIAEVDVAITVIFDSQSTTEIFRLAATCLMDNCTGPISMTPDHNEERLNEKKNINMMRYGILFKILKVQKPSKVTPGLSPMVNMSKSTRVFEKKNSKILKTCSNHQAHFLIQTFLNKKMN